MEDSWDEPGGLQRALIEEEQADDDDTAAQYVSATEASEAALLVAEGGNILMPPQRSPLSRQASMSNLLDTTGEEEDTHRQLTSCQKAGTWFTATLLMGTLLAVAFVMLAFPSPSLNGAPNCRSGAAAATMVLAHNGSQHLVVWSGRGQSGAVFHEWLHTLSLVDFSWERVKPEGDPKQKRQQAQQAQQKAQQQELTERKPPAPLPHGRWKEAVTSLSGLGMLVHGGNAPEAALATVGKDASMSDTWLLNTALRWEMGSSSSKSPSARHSHSMVSYKDAEGRRAVLLFGGRRADGVLLNDVWKGKVSWPNISWQLLNDPQSAVGSGPSPLPRSGHAAAMLNSTTMLVHGGRSEVYGSFADVWAFSLVDSCWTPLTPSTSAQPPPRDHHAAAVFANQLHVFGGRFGTVVQTSLRPLGDRWVFDIETSVWRMLPVRGFSPLPRFLFAATQYTPTDGGADQLVVFGGETGAGCKLNDAWALDLDTHHWSQLSITSFATRECKNLFG